jgi:hypothetical protein
MRDLLGDYAAWDVGVERLVVTQEDASVVRATDTGTAAVSRAARRR